MPCSATIRDGSSCSRWAQIQRPTVTQYAEVGETKTETAWWGDQDLVTLSPKWNVSIKSLPSELRQPLLLGKEAKRV